MSPRFSRFFFFGCVPKATFLRKQLHGIGELSTAAAFHDDECVSGHEHGGGVGIHVGAAFFAKDRDDEKSSGGFLLDLADSSVKPGGLGAYLNFLHVEAKLGEVMLKFDTGLGLATEQLPGIGVQDEMGDPICSDVCG